MIKSIAVLALLGLISKEQVLAQEAGTETTPAAPTCDSAMKCAEEAVQTIITAPDAPTTSVTLTDGVDCTDLSNEECAGAQLSLTADTAEEAAIDTVETVIEEAEAVTDPAEEAVAIEEAIEEAVAEVEVLVEAGAELEANGDVDGAEEVQAAIEEITAEVEAALVVEETLAEENPTDEEVAAAVALAEAEVEALEELLVVTEESLAEEEAAVPDPAAEAAVVAGNAAEVQPSAVETGAEVSAATQGNTAAQGNGGGTAVANTNTTEPATPAATPAAEPTTPAAEPTTPAAEPTTPAATGNNTQSNSNSARAMNANSLYLQSATTETGDVFTVEGNSGLDDGTAADLAAKIGAGAEDSVVPFIVAEANAASTCIQWKYVSSQLAIQEFTWTALHDGDHDGDEAKQAADVACKDAIRVYNQWIATNIWGHCDDSNEYVADFVFPADGYATATAAYYLAAETATVAQLDTLIPADAAEDDPYAAFKAVLVAEEEVLGAQLDEVTPAAAGGSGGTIAVAVVALLAVGGLGYYCFTKKDEGAEEKPEGGCYETLL